jgi:acid phosphatase
MNEPPASIPAHWMMCKSARNFRAAVAELTAPGEEGTRVLVNGSMPFRKAVERKNGMSIEGEW